MFGILVVSLSCISGRIKIPLKLLSSHFWSILDFRKILQGLTKTKLKKKRKIRNEKKTRKLKQKKPQLENKTHVFCYSQNWAVEAGTGGSIGFFTLIEPLITPLQSLLEK